MNLPAKIVGLFLLAGSFLAYLRFRRALRRGFAGPSRRRIHRDASPWRFRFALTSYFLTVLISLAAAALCLSHGFRH